MRKGEQTKEAILERAVELFNVRGFSGASLSELMQATGLQKGGIYNHFASKEDLALQAFDYAVSLVSQRLMDSLKNRRTPMERLLGIISFFEGYFGSPPFKGGCIVLNTAIDSDDTFPILRERARHAMNLWRDLIRRTVTRGITQGKILPTADPDAVATLIIGTLEGAFMMTRLYDDQSHVQRAVEHLTGYVSTLQVSPDRP